MAVTEQQARFEAGLCLHTGARATPGACACAVCARKPLGTLGPIPGDTGDRMRKDDGKPRFDLYPPEPLIALADLYAFGAKKYAPHLWEEGMSWGRCFGALMRHAWKFWRGEDYDAETGAHHMIAVAWNAFAIYTYAVRKKGTDDRWKSC